MKNQTLNPNNTTDRKTKNRMAAIRQYVNRIAERFHPQKVVLFGSYAYGHPDSDSDVDLLVIMSAKNQIDQACKIRLAFPPPPFPMDLIVRTPEICQRRLEEGESFITEIMSNGIVLYEEDNGKVGQKSGS